MERAGIAQFASALYEAERNRIAISPLTAQDPSLTVGDAYGIQLENVRRAVREGQVVSGKKIGLTSPDIQAQLGVSEPDYGHLFAAMDCSSGEIASDALIQPKIEAELAFVLKKDLTGGSVGVREVRDATEYVAGAFEIVDSRIKHWKVKLADTVADNASSGRYIVGKTRLPISGLNMSAIAMTLYQNGSLVHEGSSAAVMGDPCLAVAWLSNRLWDFGIPLKKGEIILSGAFTSAPPAKKGDSFKAVFSLLGEVEAKFL